MFNKNTLLSFLILSSGTAFSAELSIPIEKSFDEKVYLPKPLFHEGRFNKPLAPGWNCLDLNGVWKFKEVPFVEGRERLDDLGIEDQFFSPSLDDRAWEDFEIPSILFQNKKLADKNKVIGYFRRNFPLGERDLACRYILDFRAAGERADVWINGKSAGKHHIGSESSFQYDVSDLLATGWNQICVRIYITRTNNYLLKTQGITDTVRLYAVKGDFSVTRAMITPELADNSFDIRIQMLGKGKEIYAELSDGSKKKFIVPQADDDWYHLGKMSIKKPHFWTPDDPYLYTLTLKDEKGNVVGFENFGYRSFTTSGEWFLLNGEKIKPKMHSLHLHAVENLNYNSGSTTEMLLRTLKSMGVNMLRPHSGHAPNTETLLNICDRIGMMVYIDWHGTNLPACNSPGKFMDTAPSFQEYIRDSYAHPCIVMWSNGNELYERCDVHWTNVLDKMYGVIKEVDLQKRPVTSSAGRHRLEDVAAGLCKERFDFYDDHQYRGAFCGSWQENIAHIENYARIAGSQKPKVDSEYGMPGDTARYRSSISQAVADVMKMPQRNSAEFKKKYIALIRQTNYIGELLRIRSNYATVDDYVDRRGNYRRYAEPYAKRFLEIYRRAGVKCIAYHANNLWCDAFRDFDESSYNGIGDICAKDPGEWRYMPLYYVYKRIYNPVFVCAGIFNQQPFSGGEESVTLTTINDLADDGDFELSAQYRFENGNVFKFPDVNVGLVKSLEQKDSSSKFKFPVVDKIDHGTLELFLFKDGKNVNDNRYPVTLYPKRDVAFLPEKCALYDSACLRMRGLFDTPSTLEVLKELKGNCALIRDFSNLNDFTHLILGANCFDRQVVENGDKIFDWVKKGGKLLVLEQSFCGKIPFLGNYKINAGNPGTFVTLVDYKHPIFRNFKAHDLDSWAGNMGQMARNTIMPLNEGLVASISCTAVEDVDCIQSVLNDVKIGKGEIILSQILTLERFRKSGAAREYLVALLDYFSRSEVSEHALEIGAPMAGKVTYLEDKRAFFFDLSKAANRAFADKTAGGRESGWADFGPGSDFKEMPLGTSRLQGGVPFKIIDPAENGGKSCIVMKGAPRPYFPNKVAGIPVNQLLNSIFILHTSMYGVKYPGETVRYILNYEDGQKHTFIADSRYDIPDWWNGAAQRNALPVFRVKEKTLYMSEFVNPRPNVKITTLDIESAGGAIPVIIAVTGRLRSASIIAGFGEK